MTLVLALRGAATIGILALLAGGVPRLVSLGLAAAVGLWSALLVGAPAEVPPDATELVVIAARELVLGATIGLIAVLPILAAQTAGRFVDAAGRVRETYGTMFSVLAAAVFVGIDGHVIVVTTLVDSFREVPALATTQPRVLDAIGMLVASAVRLAVPWLVTAAVAEIAVGVGMRVAGRAGASTPTAAAVPAALGMMTATLVSVFAVAFAQMIVR